MANIVKNFTARETWTNSDGLLATVEVDIKATANLNPSTLLLYLKFELQDNANPIRVTHGPYYTSTNAYDAFGLWPMSQFAQPLTQWGTIYRTYGPAVNLSNTWESDMQGLFTSPMAPILLITVDVTQGGGDTREGALVDQGYWEQTIQLTSADFDSSGRYTGKPLLSYTQRYLNYGEYPKTDHDNWDHQCHEGDRMAFGKPYDILGFIDFRYHPGAIRRNSDFYSHNRSSASSKGAGNAKIRKSGSWAVSESTEIWNYLLTGPDNDGFIKSGSFVRQDLIGNDANV